MRILVTGSLGFVGSNLCSFLLNKGHEVLGFDNLFNPSINPTDRIKKKSGDNWKNFKFYNCDIRELNQMTAILANEPIDLVVHLAALGSVPRSFNNPADVIDVNEKGFANVMRITSLSEKKKIVYASSSSVYGSDQSRVRTESKIGLPLSPYSLSKLNNELFADLWGKHAGINHVGLRFFNVYGPGQRHDSEYSAVIPKFAYNDEIIINGDGTVIRDFTHVDDVCEAIYKAIDYDKNDIFNVGTGLGTTISWIANLVCFHSKQKPITYKPARKTDVMCSIADTVKAEKLLKFKSNIFVGKGIESLLNEK